MNKQAKNFSPEYLALMLGLGVNPIVSDNHMVSVLERPYSSLTKQIKESPVRLSSRWQSGHGLKWFSAN